MCLVQTYMWFATPLILYIVYRRQSFSTEGAARTATHAAKWAAWREWASARHAAQLPHHRSRSESSSRLPSLQLPMQLPTKPTPTWFAIINAVQQTVQRGTQEASRPSISGSGSYSYVHHTLMSHLNWRLSCNKRILLTMHFSLNFVHHWTDGYISARIIQKTKTCNSKLKAVCWTVICVPIDDRMFWAGSAPNCFNLLQILVHVIYNMSAAAVAGFPWAVNADECLMTRMQEISLDYHFTVEQEVGSSTYAFFGFNGKLRLFQNLYHSFSCGAFSSVSFLVSMILSLSLFLFYHVFQFLIMRHSVS